MSRGQTVLSSVILFLHMQTKTCIHKVSSNPKDIYCVEDDAYVSGKPLVIKLNDGAGLIMRSSKLDIARQPLALSTLHRLARIP